MDKMEFEKEELLMEEEEIPVIEEEMHLEMD